MLINCPECHETVSDKAAFCPHCGFPFAKAPRRQTPRRPRSLPNGFGQITCIKGLANPYRAMVTVGHNDEGRPIAKLLKPKAYFPTYADAYAALQAFHRSPYDPLENPTIAELFDRWTAMRRKESTANSSTRALVAVWRYCDSIALMPVRDFRARHLRTLLEVAALPDGTAASANTKYRIKTLFNLMMDYAVEYELIPTNYARAIDLPEKIARTANDRTHHTPYTEDDLSALWKYADDPATVADLILVTCYAGWRPAELLSLRLEDLDPEARTFSGGMKTDAGRNRLVPIHAKIWPIVSRHTDASRAAGSAFIFTRPNGTPWTTNAFSRKYAETIALLRLDHHTPHDGRTTFVTRAKAANMDEYAIKHIVGHAITDLTESVYTRRSLSWLRDELAKIS